MPNDSFDQGNEPDAPDHGAAEEVHVQDDFSGTMNLYLLVFCLLFLAGPLLQGFHFTGGLIVSQLLLVLLPALFYLRRRGLAPRVFARLRPLPPPFIPVIILLSLSTALLNLIISLGLLAVLTELGFSPVAVFEPPLSLSSFFAYIIALGLVAALGEEVLFRGTILPSLESRGLLSAVIYSSLLFALIHVSFLRFVNTFTLGLVMALIVIKSGSLWGGILYHFLNNFYAVTLLFLSGLAETPDPAGAEGADPVSLFSVAFLLFILAAGGALLGFRLLQGLSGRPPLLAGPKTWLPPGWLNWQLGAAFFLFLVMALFEMIVGFSGAI